RMAFGVGPYLRGARSPGGAMPDVATATLRSVGTFRDNVALARAGNLPFFLLAVGVVFLWTRYLFGKGAAIWSVLLFSSSPAVLAAAGLATTDMACCATVACALYTFVRCVETPSWWRLAGLGAALALAFLSKFTSVPFLAACIFGSLGYFLIASRNRLAAA